MEDKIIQKVANILKIKEKQVSVVLKLLKEGNTVPFIARYRKEATEFLDEDQIREVEKEYLYSQKLEKRKEEILNRIDEKGMLTQEIKEAVMTADKLQLLEDIYLPFKEKKKTKATEAIKNGLKPLAIFIKNGVGDIGKEAKKYINENIKNIEEALAGALYILAENISDNSEYRQKTRENMWKFASLETKAKKDAKQKDEKEKYKIYYDFSQTISKLPSYRILAINRAEKEKVITVKFNYNVEFITNHIVYNEAKGLKQEYRELISNATNDALKRLILPSIQREIRKELTDQADVEAIKIFENNLEKLIMQNPLKGKIILGIDPAFRTGCKYAVISEAGEKEQIGVIYPHEPVNKKEEAAKVIKEIVKEYKVKQIVIGNGTASRETEEFVDSLQLGVPYNLVSEAGASVYSASKIAQEEFPDLTVEYRSAISIARRVQDPMAELVKIEPKAIGVGQYQHDVNQKLLIENLDFVMIKSINKVGVDLNTASKELLQYISGLDKGLAKNIIDYRNEIGSYTNRKQLKKVKRLGTKAFTQAAGFLKILNGDDFLDTTFIHPEDYKVANKIIKLAEKKEQIYTISEESIKELEKQEITKIKIEEIINYLNKPNLDIREKIKGAVFSRKIKKIEDLKVGEIIQGEVRNVLEFGAFVDIGLKNDALVHISELSNNFIKNVEEVLKLGEIKQFKIKNVDLEKGRVELSLKEIK